MIVYFAGVSHTYELTLFQSFEDRSSSPSDVFAICGLRRTDDGTNPGSRGYQMAIWAQTSAEFLTYAVVDRATEKFKE